MGFETMSWEEWKKYYRRLHGKPEDGIKRIKFEGKRKKRNIDWGPRLAVSIEELKSYGIETSKNGPTMIPFETAMKLSDALFQGAKTIHSIRDGLEVMRMGLDSETTKVKEKQKPALAVAQTANVSTPQPAVALENPSGDQDQVA